MSTPGATALTPEPDSGVHEWPLHSRLELGALPTAVPCARLHARQVTLEWGLRDLADITELIVSELVTNAIRASRGLISPVVGLSLVSDRSCVLIRVWDGNREQMPVRQQAGPDAEYGRGLVLVDAISAEWGSYRRANGKVVWAMVVPAAFETAISRGIEA
jgi:anti-sigma regulatory factor (Ser/Thr protein kinase)